MNKTEEHFMGLSNVDCYIPTAFFEKEDFENKCFGVCLFKSLSSVGRWTHTGNDRGCCQPGMIKVLRVRHRMKDRKQKQEMDLQTRHGSSWLFNSGTLKSILGCICKASGETCMKKLDKPGIVGSDTGQRQQRWVWRAQGGKNRECRKAQGVFFNTKKHLPMENLSFPYWRKPWMNYLLWLK